ncbi:(2Fe-2S)-binding protein [Paracoccus aestuariivivens]|uniref:(2Fe-2S)-binding protein n=1 Tax=Paracoccus aestuariivivens TaxID=1820333 RepID=A0A6L6JEL8_9RHOB|nr:(2Fe-2S)-binding protein [Paracoccus aestuariivivens]MTH78361.1 (2Fe-2S)-binding protein [Paracoccus aestuariivivens]
MFRRIEAVADEIGFFFDGRPLRAMQGETVATALLASGVGVFRSSVVSGAPRAPLCLMGVCFDCLVEIDGVENRQSCLVEIREGMDVRSQNRARQLKQGTISCR